MICDVKKLEKAFPDKDMRDYYVMYHWQKCVKWMQRDGYICYSMAAGQVYKIEAEKVYQFEKNGVFIHS